MNLTDSSSVSSEKYFKEVYRDFPKWAICLAGLRGREGLTQRELGQKLNIHQSNISKMERGLCPIGKQMAYRFASFFGVRYKMFLDVRYSTF